MVFFLLSYFSYIMQNFSNKAFNKKLETVTNGALLVQNGGGTLVATLVLFLIGNFEFLSPKIMLFAVFYGILYLLAIFFLLIAFTTGSVGGSSLLCNTGMFIAAIYGIIVFNDKFTLYIGISVVLMFLSIVFLTSNNKGEKRFNFRWLVFGLSSGVCNACLGIIKRIVVSQYPDNIQNFLAWGYLFATITAFSFIVISKQRRKDSVVLLKKPKMLIYSVFTGLGNAGGSGFQMKALLTVSSAIIYPLTSCLLSVSLWLASLLIYKETKLTLKNVLAIVFCVMAIILMNIG